MDSYRRGRTLGRFRHRRPSSVCGRRSPEPTRGRTRARQPRSDRGATSCACTSARADTSRSSSACSQPGLALLGSYARSIGCMQVLPGLVHLCLLSLRVSCRAGRWARRAASGSGLVCWPSRAGSRVDALLTAPHPLRRLWVTCWACVVPAAWTAWCVVADRRVSAACWQRMQSLLIGSISRRSNGMAVSHCWHVP